MKEGGESAHSVSVGVLAVEDEAGPLVLALDAVDDALRHLDQELRRALGVTNIDVLALQYIDRRQRRGTSTRVGDLVPRLGVSSGTATMIVQRLERAHLIQSATDPNDGRGRTIVLGLRAHELVEGRLGGVRTGLRQLVASLPPEQEDELIDLLDRVRQILLHPAADTDAGIEASNSHSA